MRIEDLKQKIELSIKSILEQYIEETGMRVGEIGIRYEDTRGINDRYKKYRVAGIRLMLDYEG